jgi:hypothetical protein
VPKFGLRVERGDTGRDRVGSEKVGRPQLIHVAFKGVEAPVGKPLSADSSYRFLDRTTLNVGRKINIPRFLEENISIPSIRFI